MPKQIWAEDKARQGKINMVVTSARQHIAWQGWSSVLAWKDKVMGLDDGKTTLIQVLALWGKISENQTEVYKGNRKYVKCGQGANSTKAYE